MALFKLGQVFTFNDANAIKKLWANASAPDGADTGEIFLDMRVTPFKLKRYNGSVWEVIGTMNGSEVLTALLGSDGSGSGLDADLLDGQQGSYYRNAGNLNAGTISLDRVPTVLIGKDADKLDGQEGSFYQNATNLTSGTLDKSRLPAQVVRTDQDTYLASSTYWMDYCQVRVGNDADGRFFHNGTDTILDNYTGDIYLRQQSHGGNIILQAEDETGTRKDMLTIDPDQEKVESKGRYSSIIYQNEPVADNSILEVKEVLDGTLGIVFVKCENLLSGFVGFTATIFNSGMVNASGSSSVWSTTKDTASRINVYIEPYKYICIQNKKGSAINVTVGFYGLNKP